MSSGQLLNYKDNKYPREPVQNNPDDGNCFLVRGCSKAGVWGVALSNTGLWGGWRNGRREGMLRRESKREEEAQICWRLRAAAPPCTEAHLERLVTRLIKSSWWDTPTGMLKPQNGPRVLTGHTVYSLTYGVGLHCMWVQGHMTVSSNQHPNGCSHWDWIIAAE